MTWCAGRAFERWAARVMAALLVVGGLGFVAMVAQEVRYEWFVAHHTCLRGRTYWGDGYFVGVPGKGGRYEPAGWRWTCVAWTPDDGPAPAPVFPINAR